MLNILVVVFGGYLIAGVLASVYNARLKRNGLAGISWSECFSPRKMFSVFLGFVVSFSLPDHIFEQLVLRFYDPECRPDCLESESGSCKHCGCNTRAKMASPFEKCSAGNWGEIIWSESKYRQFRAMYPVKIKVEYDD